jgi:hypothetical protein
LAEESKCFPKPGELVKFAGKESLGKETFCFAKGNFS